MEFRQAKLDDIDMIADLMIISFYDSFRVLFGKKMNKGKNVLIEYLKLGNSIDSVFVAVDNNEVVGVLVLKIKETQKKWGPIIKVFIKNLGLLKGLKTIFLGGYLQLSIKKDKCLLDYICIMPEARGSGIGKKLIKYGENYVTKMNKKYMYSFINPLDDRIHILYKSGFEKKKVRKSIVSKIFFKKPIWVYIEKKI